MMAALQEYCSHARSLDGTPEISSSLLPSLRRSIIGGLMGRGATAVLQLGLTPLLVASTAGSIIQIVYGIQLQQIAGYADLQSVFSQYRIKKAHIVYKPYFRGGSTTNTGLFCAGIDYGPAVTVLSNFTSAVQLSDSKLVPCDEANSWDVTFAGTGNYDWLDILTTPTQASLKTYSDANSGVGISANYGTFGGYVDVEFKGVE
jgi:hypothetical protein